MTMTIRTPEKAAAILAALRENPSYAAACRSRKVRISRNAFHEWRRDDPAFAAACLAARNEGLDALEDALTTRGMKDDTTAAIFMLKSLRRETYGDKIDHTHQGLILFAPDWVALRTAILDALAIYPEAKAAVLAKIETLGAGDESAGG